MVQDVEFVALHTHRANKHDANVRDFLQKRLTIVNEAVVQNVKLVALHKYTHTEQTSMMLMWETFYRRRLAIVNLRLIYGALHRLDGLLRLPSSGSSPGTENQGATMESWK